MSQMLTKTLSQYLASAEELIEEARAGRMFILVDDEDRENEGDLIIPAQFATPDAINFMAKYARGLICLAMTRQRVEQLGLPLMSQQNGTRHQTAFTVSIEAREGVIVMQSVAKLAVGRVRTQTRTVCFGMAGGEREKKRGRERRDWKI